MIAVYLIIALAAVGMNTTVGWVRGGLQRLAAKRMRAKVDLIGPRFIGKIVRHAPSGRIGFCIGVGHPPLKPWRFGARIMVQFVVCPDCARGVREMGALGAMIAASSGHVEHRPIQEVVSALASEASEFSAAMKGAE